MTTVADNGAVERVQKRAELRRLAKVAHDAIDDYVESRLGDGDWFVRDLDGVMLRAVNKLWSFGLPLTPEEKAVTRVEIK